MQRSPSNGYVSSYLTRPLRSLAKVLSERGEPAEIALQMAAMAPAVTSATFQQENAAPRHPARGPMFPAPAYSSVRAALESRRAEINARRAWLANSGNVAAARALTQDLVTIEAALAEPPLSELADLAIAC